MLIRRSTLAMLAALLSLSAWAAALAVARPALAQGTKIYLPFISRAESLAFATNRESGSSIVALRGNSSSTLSGPTTNDSHPVLSPDGRLIAFFSTRGGSNAAYVMGIDAANPRKLADCNICIDIAWAPDSRSFLLGQQKERLTGGNYLFATLVFVDGSSSPARSYDLDAAWSPTGDRIAFTDVVSGDLALRLERLDSGDRTTLAMGQITSGSLAWSPDGMQIAYTLLDGSNSAIAVAMADGSGARRLASGTGPAWSPDGTRIAFLAPVSGSTTTLALSTIEIDGQHLMALGAVPADSARPSWAPDGAQIATLAKENGKNSSMLYRADPVAGGMTATSVDATAPGQMAWSPGGAKILVSATYRLDNSVHESDAALVVVERGSSSPLTVGTGRMASWMPDGGILAAATITAPVAIYYAYQGGTPTPLVTGDLPSLAPDGRWVAYVRGDQLRLIGTDGQGARLLAGGLEMTSQPAWSPDGTLIAFSSSGLSLIGADGSGLRQLPSLPASSQPAWSPDGTQIAFSGQGGVYVTDLAGATLRRIADGTSPAWSPDGSKIAYISTYLWQAGADGTDPTMIWTCGAGSSSVVSCSLSDVGWSRDGRLISFVEERSDGKESSLHVVVIDAASRAMTFSTEGSAPRWVAGSNRLAFIRTENFGFYSTYPMPYDYWSSYAKLCVITLPDGTCASLPIGHGDVLSYDVGL